MLVLSSTSFAEASVCLKRYEYHQVDRLVPAPKELSPKIRKGVWIHRALEYDAHGRPWLDGLAECLQWAFDNGVDQEQAQDIHAECFRILKGYFDYWATQPYWKWRVLSAEQKYSAVLGDTVTVGTTTDKLVEWQGGVWLVEHKSTGHMPSATWRGVDPQTALQMITCMRNGITPDGVIFDYLITREPPKLRVKKDGRLYANEESRRTTSASFDETAIEIINKWDASVDSYPGPYINEMRQTVVNDGMFYHRFDVRRTNDMLAETLRDLASIVGNITQAQQTGHYRRLNNILYCERFCSYSRLCATEYILGRKSESMRENDFMIEDPDQREARGPVWGEVE